MCQNEKVMEKLYSQNLVRLTFINSVSMFAGRSVSEELYSVTGVADLEND